MEEKDISIVVPVYNEEKSLPELYKRLHDEICTITKKYEMIFVNDGSNDQSLAELKEFSKTDSRVYYINFSRNFGHQIAVTAGLEFCKGNCVVIIDSDLQDPPELISQLYREYKKGFDVVYAKRKEREGETLLKKVTAKWFYRVLEKMTSFEIPLDAGDFRLLDRRVVNALKSMTEQNKFLRGQIAWLGFKQTHVLYDRDSRKHGKTAYTYSKMFKLAFDAITSFSDKPLLFVSRMGLAISVLSFFVILYAIFAHFILKQTITGWTSLIISFMFIGGIQLLSVGIIGEYISRINTNVKDRPLYVIEETNLPSENK